MRFFLPAGPYLPRYHGSVLPRLLGLDFGDRRIGVAVSDELGLTAQPVLTLLRKNLKADLKSLGRLLRKYGCTAIVLETQAPP